MTTGSEINALDFVSIQDKAEALLGTGSGSRGYGQYVNSADVFSGNIITKAQWDALRYDIINIRYHQDGEIPPIVTVNKGDPIGYGANSPNSNYNTLLETAITNRFQLSPNQSVVTARGSASTSNTWTSSAEFILTVTFKDNDPNEGRYFFNSGGKIRITPNLVGGSGTAQVSAWKTILTSVGTQSFGAATDNLVNYYTLTNNWQTFFQRSLSTPYSANLYRMEAKTDVANNSLGTARILYIKVSLLDNYVDSGPEVPPGDAVNGTLSLSVEELKASGSLQPSGSFSINSPIYSLSSISTI